MDFKFKKIYNNLHLISTQLLIKSENKQKCGIYLINNNINNKFYIGSATTNRINMRFRNHCIHGTGSKVINRSIQKYGLENFSFFILEYFPGFVKKENLNKDHIALLKMETLYIEKFNPAYNILKIGFSNLDYKNNEESKLEIKENYSIDHKEPCENINYNKT
jgi:group I intron endonuclease